MSDKVLEILSQTNGAVIVAVAALFVFFIVKAVQYTKIARQYFERWRQNENEKEKREKQIEENTAAVADLAQQHKEDMETWNQMFLESRKQSTEAKEEMQQEIKELRSEMSTVVGEVLTTLKEMKDEDMRRDKEQVARDIEGSRYKIIRFSKEVRKGDRKSRDEYQHIFKCIDNYHKILDEQGLENGQIDIEVACIKDHYKEALEKDSFIT